MVSPARSMLTFDDEPMAVVPPVGIARMNPGAAPWSAVRVMTTADASAGTALGHVEGEVASGGSGPPAPPDPKPVRVSRTRIGSTVTKRPGALWGTGVK